MASETDRRVEADGQSAHSATMTPFTGYLPQMNTTEEVILSLVSLGFKTIRITCSRLMILVDNFPGSRKIHVGSFLLLLLLLLLLFLVLVIFLLHLLLLLLLLLLSLIHISEPTRPP